MAVPGARAARSHDRVAGARVPRPDLPGGRFGRGDLVRVQGPRRALPRGAPGRPCARSSVPADADPSASLPVAYRDLDELDGFLENFARDVHERGYRVLSRRSSTTARCAPTSRPPPGRATPSRLPGRAARAHGRGRDAGARGLPAAPAPELRPAADRGARARHRQDARVRLRRRDRAVRCGTPARPRRARPADARAADGRARARAPARAAALRALPPRRGRRAGAPLRGRPRRSRCTGSTRSTRASRARSSTGSADPGSVVVARVGVCGGG